MLFCEGAREVRGMASVKSFLTFVAEVIVLHIVTYYFAGIIAQVVMDCQKKMTRHVLEWAKLQIPYI